VGSGADVNGVSQHVGFERAQRRAARG
jgi:hypothetical protein